MININSGQLLGQIIIWIQGNVDQEIEIHANTLLLAESVLDSMRLLLLISHFEEKLGMSIDEAALLPENFETPEKIASLFESMLAGKLA